jgi:hypothetical protein
MYKQYRLFITSSGIILTFALLIWIFANHHEANKTTMETIPPIVLQSLNKFGFKTDTEQKAVMTFLHANHIKIPANISSENADKWFRDATQKMLRIHERWTASNMVLEKRLQSSTTALRNAAKELNMTLPKAFTEKQAVSAIVPWGVELSGRKRLDGVRNALSSGVHITDAWLLTGYRPLLLSEARHKTLRHRSEPEMAAAILKEYQDKYPEIRKLTWHFINTPRRSGNNRATTVDTVFELLDHQNHLNKDIVVFIEQPHARRFLTIFSAILKTKKVHLSTLEATQKPIPMFLLQDELAREIYIQYASLKNAKIS